MTLWWSLIGILSHVIEYCQDANKNYSCNIQLYNRHAEKDRPRACLWTFRMPTGVVYDVMQVQFHYVMHSTGTNGSHSRHQILSCFLRSRVWYARLVWCWVKEHYLDGFRVAGLRVYRGLSRGAAEFTMPVRGSGPCLLIISSTLAQAQQSCVLGRLKTFW